MTPVDNKVVPTLTLSVEREWINNAAWILSLKYKAAGIHKSDEAILGNYILDSRTGVMYH
jgi:hypothetical protein